MAGSHRRRPAVVSTGRTDANASVAAQTGAPLDATLHPHLERVRIATQGRSAFLVIVCDAGYISSF